MADTPLPTTTVTFHRRQWDTRDGRLSFAIKATAQLAWRNDSPASSNLFLSPAVPAARVAELVRAGRLWVGTDGHSVRLGIRTTLGGKGRLTAAHHAQVRRLVADWAWDELGLRVGTMQDADVVLCHPPAADGMYAPQGVPHARFVRVDCELRFSVFEAEKKETRQRQPCPGYALVPVLDSPPPDRPAGRKRSRGQGQSQHVSATPTARSKPVPKTRPAPRRTNGARTRLQRREELDCQRKTRSQTKTEQTPAPPVSQPSSRPRPPVNAIKDAKDGTAGPERNRTTRRLAASPGALFDDAQGGYMWDRARLLVETGLALFVGTKFKLSSSVRAADRASGPAGWPSLLDVAPAVWSNGLFRAAASRAEHIPLVHAALSAMFTSIQVPSVRRKAEAYGLAEPGPAGRDALLGKLEGVLLRGTLLSPHELQRTPSRLQPARRTRTHLPSPDPTPVTAEPIIKNSARDSTLLDDSDALYDLDADSLDAVFSQSQSQSQPRGDDAGAEPEYVGSESGAESDAAVSVDWDDIAAWEENEDVSMDPFEEHHEPSMDAPEEHGMDMFEEHRLLFAAYDDYNPGEHDALPEGPEVEPRDEHGRDASEALSSEWDSVQEGDLDAILSGSLAAGGSQADERLLHEPAFEPYEHSQETSEPTSSEWDSVQEGDLDAMLSGSFAADGSQADERLLHEPAFELYEHSQETSEPASSDWGDVGADQLDAMLAPEGISVARPDETEDADDGFMDIDDADALDVVAVADYDCDDGYDCDYDYDEGVGLWQDEQAVIEHSVDGYSSRN